MRLYTATAIALLTTTSLISAAPTASTVHGHSHLPDGMPNPSPSEIEQIEESAHGTLPNGPPPPHISNEGITNLKLIAFNELFEVAFFYELLTNVTDNVDGYRFLDPDDREFVIESLQAILAQEELHALSANQGLSHFNISQIEPCSYTFPVEDFESAVVLASTFTDLVIGTLQDTVERFAVGRDFALTRTIASVIGQEGEQQGWYRVMQGKIPSELPFLTTSDLSFAFTAIQEFVVPGSCPNINEIPLRTFQPLTILTPPGPKTQTICVSFPDDGHDDKPPLWMTYINQLNLPIVEPLEIISRNDSHIVAEAVFPFDENEMNGLTIAAVTKSRGPFGNANIVAKWTLAGPGLIIVN